MTEAVPQTIANMVSSSANETERLAALRRYNILDTPAETAFDRITALAARLFGVPTALVSLVDESRAWFKSCYGFDRQEVPRDATICSFALLSDDVLVVPDARQDDRFACNPFVQSEPGLRFYAGAPLITQDSFNLGTLCLLDTQPREALTDEQTVILADLAAIVVDELELRLAVAMQMAAEQARQQSEQMRQAAAQDLQLYVDVVRNAQVGLVVWQLEDLDDPGSFRLLVANPAASEATGFDFEPMIGKTMAEGFPQLLQTPLVQHYMEVVRTGQSLDLGEVAYGADGISPGIYSLKAFPLPNRCFGLAFENITDRKHIEAQLQESQHYNQQITEALPGVLFVYDLIQQQNVYTNRQITDLLGYTSEQVQAMGANVIATLIHPNDLTRVLTYFETFRDAPDDAVLGIEYQAHHANGEWRWMYSQSVVFNRTAEGLPHQILGVSIDITDRKHSEEALRQAQVQLKAALAAGAIYTWHWNISENRLTTDAAFAHLFGVDPEQAAIGLPLEAFTSSIHEADHSRVLAVIQQAIETGEAYVAEYRVRTATGEERWVAARGSVEYDAMGRPLSFPGALADITEHKQAESERQHLLEQVKIERAFLEAVIRQMPAGVIIAKAPSGQLVLGNEQVDRIWRHSFVQAKDIAQYQEYRGFHPNGQPYSPHDWPLARSIRTGEVVIDEETDFLRGDDTQGTMLVSSTPIHDAQGQIFAGVVTFSDITERKQAERSLREHTQRLNLLYETTRELLSAQHPLDLMNWLFAKLSAQMDLHYYYHFQVSQQDGQQRLRLMNYSGITEQEAQSFESLDLGQAMCGLVAQERRQIVLNQADIATHPNAQIIYSMGVSAYAGQPLIVQGRLLGTLSFASLTRSQFTAEEVYLLQAISEQVAIALDRAELVASLQQQTENLIQANRVKDEFLAVLSHELRSPLNPILGWTKLLQTGRFDPQKTQQALAVIERNARQQTQLIDDLLDISKILRGKLTLREAPVDLAFTVESAIETIRLAAEAKSIGINTTFDPSIPPVLGDAGRLQQIVLNLLSNAVKFTPQGGQVEVRVEQIGTEAQIQVKDTGKGIAPDFLPYVFESFRQEDGKTTRKFGGLGLGLAIVRQLTELHGGTVRVASPGEGAGATFTIRLPLMKTHPLSFADSSQTDRAASKANVLQGIRVLVVDDEADMRELMVMILEQAGAIAQMAASAAEALTALDQFQPMLLISDIGMPETDGYELMQQVQSRVSHSGRPIAAIALTAYAMEQDQQQALAAGFQRHLAKPIEPEVLVEAIVALLNQE
jgi:PAS domain S-box-containing protein